jgi:monoamine oxidase
MSDLTRREFIRQSMLLAAGMALVSCEDDQVETGHESPGALSGTQPSKRVIIVGAGISGLVAGYELSRAGHDVTILEARNRVGGRVFTLRTPFSDGHFADAGAARIPPDHDMTIGYADHFGLTLDPFYPESSYYVNLSNDERTLISASDYLNNPPWEGFPVNRKDFIKIRGGTDKLPQAFADTLTDLIHLATPVETIEQNADGIIVGVSDGTEYSADRALCTVPLPVLNRIQFSPQLSDAKVEASSGGYNYLQITRVFMQFSNRFWESEGLNGWGNTDWPEEIWQPTWDREGPKGVLLSNLFFDRADEIDQLSEADRIEHVLNRWESVFPGVQDHVEGGTSLSWAQQEWSGGAVAYPAPEQDEALAGYIGAAEGRIHFAGEHASDYHGWMQGALVSGLRAATEIHEE